MSKSETRIDDKDKKTNRITFYNIEDILYYVEKNGKVPANSIIRCKFGIRTGIGTSQKPSGVIEFYYNDEFISAGVCSTKAIRIAFMSAALRRSKHLSGSKYFLWKPNSNDS